MTKANPSTSNEEVIKSRHVVVNIQFCSDLRSTFTVRKMPPVLSNVGSVDSIVIQDSKGNKKFIFEGSALKDSDGNLILTVKPKEGIMANLRGIIASSLHQGIMANLRGIIASSLHQGIMANLRGIIASSLHQGIMANLRGIIASSLHPGIMANLRGIIASSLHQGIMAKQWEASREDDSELLFTLKYSGPTNSINVSLTNSGDYEIEEGSLENDNYTISDMSGGIRRIAAEVKRDYSLRDDNEEIEIKSTYDVEVEPGYDQAFIFGLVAVLEQLPH